MFAETREKESMNNRSLNCKQIYTITLIVTSAHYEIK